MTKKISYVSFVLIFAVSLLAPWSTFAFTRLIVFPVDGTNHYSDDFGDARSGGRVHLGNDISAAKLTPVVAAVTGTISYLVIPEASWGYAIYLKDDDGWEYRYLHINNDTPGTDDGNGGPEHAYAPGIARGVRVTAGQLLGWVGDSGNAENVGSHLHFEMWTPDNVAISPYETLRAATAPGIAPVGSNTATPAKVVTTLIVPRNGELIKYPDSPDIYLVAKDIQYLIVDEATFNILHYSWSNIRPARTNEFYRSGIPIEINSTTSVLFDDGTLISSAPKTTIAHGAFTEQLVLGSKSSQVITLQQILKNLGYYTYPTITGYYGPVTQQAVIAFQKAHGISAVGFVGPQTRAALNAL